jgi:hypothetical protein
MKFKNFVDLSIGSLICATVLLFVDITILGIVSVKAIFADFASFWPAIREYLFNSWFAILHLTIMSLFAFGLSMIFVLKKSEE